MGMYINSTSNGETKSDYAGKIDDILKDGGNVVYPRYFIDNLVCVIDNGPFAAAAYCYDEKEFLRFSDQNDTRLKTWIVWDKVKKFAT